jgi:hypothetical protein
VDVGRATAAGLTVVTLGVAHAPEVDQGQEPLVVPIVAAAAV